MALTRRRRAATWRATALIALVAALVAGCQQPTGERRLVSIRQSDLSAGYLTGELVYVETRGVRRTAIFVHDLWTDERQRIRVPEGHANAPSWSPGGGRILFSLTGDDGMSHLWIVRLEDAEEIDEAAGEFAPTLEDADDPDPSLGRQITFGEVIDDYPRWAPDGERVVFASIRDGSYDWQIYMLSLEEGAEPERIGSDQGHAVYPDWSPDGASIVYSSRETGRYNLRLYDVATGVGRTLTQTVDGEDLYPRFTPDGRSVLFASNRDDDSWQIWSIDIATGEQRRLIGSDSMDEFPAPSPDGEFIAFSTGHLAIYRADAGQFPDGQLRWAVNQNLAWSPDWKAPG